MIASIIDKATNVVLALFSPPGQDSSQFSILSLFRLTGFAAVAFAAWPYAMSLSLAFGLYFFGYLSMIFSDVLDSGPIEGRKISSHIFNGIGIFLFLASYVFFIGTFFFGSIYLWALIADTQL